MIDLQTTLTSALASYGAIAVFISVLLAAVGVPLPVSFLLIAAGSFIEAGELDFWPIIIAATVGACIGDHLGYLIGRYGGRAFVGRLGARLGAQAAIAQAEATSVRWGGVAVFFSRWLVTAIGPYINLLSGVSRGGLLAFTPAVIAGELIWVLGYVYLGRLFNDRVSELSTMLGDATGLVLAALAAIVLLVVLVRRWRPVA
jgi:membrane protein DedA with SNARE-associated domain